MYCGLGSEGDPHTRGLMVSDQAYTFFIGIASDPPITGFVSDPSCINRGVKLSLYMCSVRLSLFRGRVRSNLIRRGAIPILLWNGEINLTKIQVLLDPFFMSSMSELDN